MNKIFKNPLVNSLSAELYIATVITLIHHFEKAPPHLEDTILIPIGMLSLFVLSAATMGYLFLGQPILLFLNGEKTKATVFFIKTVALFALITVIMFLFVLFG